jgi:limonene-1,2-epoxide hydrolase
MEQAQTDPGALRPLDPAAVRELWSRTYNPQGKPDWSHIFPYYHPDIVFQDSIQRIQGIRQFVALCNRLTKRCETLRMDIDTVVRDGNVIFMDWKMTMTFRGAPSTPIFGCTKLTLHEDGRIIEQRDYYDLWGDILNGIPPVKRPYRAFMRRFFG